jgi:hypothetical protein
LVLASVVIVALTSVGCGDLDGSTGGDSENGSESDTELGIGDKASDGQFTFVVRKIECGIPSIGAGMLKEKAQGEFCLVNVSVKNTGSEAQLMDASSQYLYIGDKQYSASSDAIFALEESQNFFLKEINPGNSVAGVMAFDIPKGGQPDRLELHDSPFSGGVTISL